MQYILSHGTCTNAACMQEYVSDLMKSYAPFHSDCTDAGSALLRMSASSHGATEAWKTRWRNLSSHIHTTTHSRFMPDSQSYRPPSTRHHYQHIPCRIMTDLPRQSMYCINAILTRHTAVCLTVCRGSDYRNLAAVHACQ